MIRVALADDASDIRFLVRFALELDGRFEVVGDAADGREAIALIEREAPDVVVLDMGMPNMDGLEVLVEMKNRGLRSKVLALSGFNGGVEDQARELGADGYLRKGTAAMAEIVPNLLAICV
ncbi:MAG TPA: response regulator transcription factor [Actinomycetota bacterium]|nr:response regulator transcription factor [Actinomycetota bacterium]